MGTNKDFLRETYKKSTSFITRHFKFFTSILISLIIFSNLFITSCKDEITQPPPKPPGYQEDIPWPSLADSPWPMFRGNPQYTGRSKYNGPVSGIIQWVYDSVYIESGVILSADNSTLFQTSGPINFKGGVYKLSQSGNLEWIYNISEIAAGTTPLILSDSTIIVSTYIGGKIIALSNNGAEKWTYDTGTYITTRGMNVGLDGTIYFMDSTKTLFALGNDGILKWTLKIENVFFGSGSNHRMAFSPNGKILYITGTDKAIYAVDVNQRAIIWSYGGKNAIASPLVDSDGNIYLYGILDHLEGEQPYLVKFNFLGQLVWKYAFGNLGVNFFPEPTIDINGNLYFGVDSLCSVDYHGSTRWKIDLYGAFNGILTSSLTCDRQNNIYVPIQKTGQPYFTILAVKDNGNLLWESNLLFGEAGDSPALGIGSLNCPTYRSTNFYLIK